MTISSKITFSSFQRHVVGQKSSPQIIQGEKQKKNCAQGALLSHKSERREVRTNERPRPEKKRRKGKKQKHIREFLVGAHFVSQEEGGEEGHI